MKKQKLVVTGAGPIGLECALRATSDGFDVTVLEKGQVGQAIRSWQHVRLFTPFGLNSSSAGRELVQSDIDESAILTGKEYCSRYLEPLAKSGPLADKVLVGQEVLGVAKGWLNKSAAIGQPARQQEPFRILVRTENDQHIRQADIVVDCTGFTQKHRWLGIGGIPCPGEISCLTDEMYGLPDVCGGDKDRFANRHTLVVGSGYSAATSVALLAEITKDAPDTRITWVTRGDRDSPIQRIADDPLPERDSLATSVNRLIREPSFIRWLPGAGVERISRTENGFAADLLWPDANQHGREELLLVDQIIANPGFRPNTSPFDELQVHRCYATEAPIKLAAHLLGQSSGDCMQQDVAGPELLKNPEPNFYILGAASYGRDNRFLLQAGLQQIEELFRTLSAEAGQ